MFQSFRNQKRWLMLIAMILIIPAFVFIGINGYSRLNPDANAIAKVADTAIQPEEFDQAKREFIETRRQQEGGQIDASEFDTPEINHAILYNLTTNRALNAELTKNYMNVSENDAIAVIKQAAAFQKDGQFSPELYENFLAARGKSDQQFVQELRGELARELLINGVKATVFIPKKSLEILNDILREERVVRTLTFDPANYMDNVKVSDDQMKAYYDAHLDKFKTPHFVDIEYVVMSPETVKVTAKPNEEELKQFYEQNRSRFGSEETRRASHILITPDSEEKDHAKAEADAKAKAEKIFAEVKANPASFAEIAKKESADLGSAEHGGDLDYFAKGQMVPEFEEAVFNAKKGDLVGPVKSEYGYHIINVTDVVPAGVKPYEEVRSEIVDMWEQQKRHELFAENADNFSNMVYEQSDTFEPEVEKFGLVIHKADGLTRQGFMDPKFASPMINKRIVEDLFLPESLQEKRNTQAVEVASNTLVSARILKDNPVRQKSFDEVKTEIKDILTLEAASKLAAEAGKAKLDQLLKKKDLAGFSKAITVSRSNPDGQPIGLISAEMAPDPKSLPTFTGFQESNGNYVVSYVESSKMPSMDDVDANRIRSEALSIQSMGDELAYYDGLKKLFNLEILKKDFDFKPKKALE